MRGFLYSGILVLVMMAIFSILALQREDVSSERESFSLRQELDTVDTSFRSIERSLHTLSDVSLRRALIASQDSVISSDSFFEEGQKAPDVLKQLMWNGTIPSNQSAVGFMGNNTLEYNLHLLEDFYSNEPRRYNVTIKIDYANSAIGLYGSSGVFFNATAEVNISKIGVANISRRIEIFERVSLAGFEDPLYLVNVTNGRLSRTICLSDGQGNLTDRILLQVAEGAGSCYGGLTSDNLASNKSGKIFFNETAYSGIDSFCGVIYKEGVLPNTSYLKVNSVSALSSLEGEKMLLLGNGDGWGIDDGLFNVSGFIAFVEDGSYVSSDDAPSFFDMLEGKTNCSYCGEYGLVGLETIIDKNTLSAPDLHIDVDLDASNTLHEYVSGVSGAKFGLNESSIGPSFYEFRMGSSIAKYFE